MTFTSPPVRPTILDRNCPNGQFRLVDRLLRLGVLAGFQEAKRL